MVLVSFDSHMTGVTSRAETPSHAGTSEFTSVLEGVPIAPFYWWCFVYHCLSLCTFSFGHCSVCTSSIDGFKLSLLVSSNFSWGRPRVVYDFKHKT